jgi:hypothetical protein
MSSVSGNSRETRLFDHQLLLPLALVIVAVIVTWFLPWNGWGWVWYACASALFLILNWGWDVRADWQRMYQMSFEFSDETAKRAPPDCRCYSVAVMQRRPLPRLIWIVVVNDHGSRVYMGWFLWSRKTPEFRKAVTRGIRRRQVA